MDGYLYIHTDELSKIKLPQRINPHDVIVHQYVDGPYYTILLCRNTLIYALDYSYDEFTDDDDNPPNISAYIQYEIPHENIYNFKNASISKIIDTNIILSNCREIDITMDNYEKYKDKLKYHFPSINTINLCDRYSGDNYVYDYTQYDDYSCMQQ